MLSAEGLRDQRCLCQRWGLLETFTFQVQTPTRVYY